MADHQSTIAFNIGSQRVSMGLFESSKSGSLVLKAYDIESFLVDPAHESGRASQIGRAIGTLVERHKLKGKVRYAISGQSVFIRFVKLPPLDDDNIEQLVTFEAQQHVPFPLDEVVWDYEILEAAGEKEVVIVAIKGDALEETNDSINAAGLGTAEVDVAPMALYNAFRAAYPGVDESVLLIDIGAKTSDLLYIEGNRFFTRSAAVGGTAITSAISKEFNVPFAEAEVHKTQSGLVALGSGHTEQLDESTAALAVSIRNAMTRLATEIPRTTNYYRSQHNGTAPKHVFLAGGGANLPYAKEFFEEKLRLPVDYFNPLGAVTLGPNVDAELISQEAHRMGEVIGLGLRGIGKTRVNIDLVPAKVGEARQAEKRRPFYIAAAALLILGAGAWALFQQQAAESARKAADSLVSQQQTLQAPSRALGRLVQTEEQLRAIAREYVEVEDGRTFWIDALQELKEAFASEVVWVVDFTPVANYNPLSGQVQPVVKGDLGSGAFGDGSLEKIKVEAPVDRNPRNGRRNAAPAEPPAPKINAVRVKGFWLKTPSTSQNVVYDLIRNLRQNAEEGDSHFRFTIENDGKEVTLEENQIAPRVEAAPGPEEFAAAFELVLPLSRELPMR